MTELLKYKNLPPELVDTVKLFTGEGCWLKGKYLNIRKISKKDFRYEILRTRPIIKQIHNDVFESPIKGAAWFKLPNGKFVLITVRDAYYSLGENIHKTFGVFWEFHYNTKTTIVRLG